MKIKTSHISIKGNNFDEQLSKLENYKGFQSLEILDEPSSNKFKITVPVFFRYFGGLIAIKVQCVILIKKEIGTTEIEIYSQLLKPFTIALIVGFGIGSLSYFFQLSLGYSVFMFFVAFFFSAGLLLTQIIKQTRSKIYDWMT